jgi:serine/threonine-protein kinase RsbW
VGLHKEQVVIEIVDHASPMQAGLLSDASAERFAFDETNLADIPESGMGLALIRMNMDEVQYSSTEGENRLRMIKRIEPRAS